MYQLRPGRIVYQANICAVGPSDNHVLARWLSESKELDGGVQRRSIGQTTAPMSVSCLQEGQSCNYHKLIAQKDTFLQEESHLMIMTSGFE